VEFILVKNKVTKNGLWRYADNKGHNIYMSPDEVAELGHVESIVVSIRPE